MKHIGFTGTRYGCKPEQLLSLGYNVLSLIFCGPYGNQYAAHHGDCVGADAEFHALASERFRWRTVGHLPEDNTHRAFCTFDETRPPLPHMRRNKAIVAAADIMIACPFDMEEKTVGGTWKTIGFTRKAGKPLAIVWPSGNVTRERWT